MRLPLWLYGKPRSQTHGAPRTFKELNQSASFDAASLGILRQVAEDVAWRVGGSSHSPCFACWPLGGEDWLLFRFLDDGMDDFNRPHTMRIEAALCRQKPWTTVIRLLVSLAWPEPVDDGVEEIILAPVASSGLAMPETAPTEPLLFSPSAALESTLFMVAGVKRKLDEPIPLGENGVMGHNLFHPTASQINPQLGTNCVSTQPEITGYGDVRSEGGGSQLSRLKSGFFAVVIVYAVVVTFLLLHNRDSHKKEMLDQRRRLEKEGEEEITAALERQRITMDGQRQRELEMRDGVIAKLRKENRALQEQSVGALTAKLRESYEQTAVLLETMQNQLEPIQRHVDEVVKQLETSAADNPPQ